MYEAAKMLFRLLKAIIDRNLDAVLNYVVNDWQRIGVAPPITSEDLRKPTVAFKAWAFDGMKVGCGATRKLLLRSWPQPPGPLSLCSMLPLLCSTGCAEQGLCSVA